MTSTQVKGMYGFGDGIYQRSFIKQISGTVYLQTPWPEIYSDLPNVRCMPSGTNLRTQKKNETKAAYRFTSAPHCSRKLKIDYSGRNMLTGMAEAMPGRFKIQPLDLPTTGPALLAGSYVIIRPCTVRKEWVAESRNPKPEYIEMAAKALKAAGIYTVCVADIDDTNEWLVGNLPECDCYYIKGELSISQVMNLAEHAVGIVSGVGFALPLAMAYKIPLLCVLGGCLGYNGPEMTTHPDSNSAMVTFATPDKPCYCKVRDHKCSKEITGYEQQLTAWVGGISQRALVPSTSAA